MPKRTGHIRVGKLFLKQVFEEFKEMKSKLQSHTLLPEQESIVKRFFKTFNIHKKPKDFFLPFYKTKLMRAESMRIKEDHSERIANYVKIFGFLRTLFLGILSGDPRIGYLTKRVKRYQKTRDTAELFESFIRVYREVIGFKKREVPKYILASANVFSVCEQKPKNLCFPPKCEYIHRTRRSRGYCRTKKTRKNKRKR